MKGKGMKCDHIMESDGVERYCAVCGSLDYQIEIKKLKKGICEHVGQDVIGSDCYLCEAAIAMKGYPKWVEKAKALREENEELRKAETIHNQEYRQLNEEIADLRSIEKEHNHTMDVLEDRVRELEEECVGYLKISVKKNGKIRSLESKLKVAENWIVKLGCKVCKNKAACVNTTDKYRQTLYRNGVENE